jgi:hypothetical protein
MRVMALVLASMLTVSVVDSQAFAANPDRTYYQGAGSCRGAAYCSYRAKSVKQYAPDFSGYTSYAVTGARRYGDVRPTRGYATAFGYHGPAYYSTHRRPRAG